MKFGSTSFNYKAEGYTENTTSDDDLEVASDEDIERMLKR